jgi:hypothetical protein
MMMMMMIITIIIIIMTTNPQLLPIPIRAQTTPSDHTTHLEPPEDLLGLREMRLGDGAQGENDDNDDDDDDDDVMMMTTMMIMRRRMIMTMTTA